MTAVDAVGEPVVGIPLEFELTMCAGGTCGKGEMIEPLTAKTGAGGAATTAYFAGSNLGAAQITASVVDDPDVSHNIVIRVTLD